MNWLMHLHLPEIVAFRFDVFFANGKLMYKKLFFQNHCRHYRHFLQNLNLVISNIRINFRFEYDFRRRLKMQLTHLRAEKKNGISGLFWCQTQTIWSFSWHWFVHAFWFFSNNIYRTPTLNLNFSSLQSQFFNITIKWNANNAIQRIRIAQSRSSNGTCDWTRHLKKYEKLWTKFFQLERRNKHWWN